MSLAAIALSASGCSKGVPGMARTEKQAEQSKHDNRDVCETRMRQLNASSEGRYEVKSC